MYGDVFRVDVEPVLVPELAPADVVIMDNLPAHKVTSIREAIESVGATCSTFRLTLRTSTQSSAPSPSSRR
jgi:hypothetical protein